MGFFSTPPPPDILRMSGNVISYSLLPILPALSTYGRRLLDGEAGCQWGDHAIQGQIP